MKNILRYFSAGAFCVVLISCGTKKTEGPASAMVKHISEAYGVNNFDKVETIRYTFNVLRDSADTISRSWEWEPKTGKVTFTGKNAQGDTIVRTYVRADVDKDTSALTKRIDHGFINDNYWLLFPYHLVWDSGDTIMMDSVRPFAIPPGSGEHLVVQYGANGGYTPGDAYELFVDSNYMVKQWVFHHGGMKEEGNPITWQHNAHVGPLTIPLEHCTPDGQPRLWFSNVAVKFTGESDWKKAE
ncbi:MAG TPA: hypothetical protein VFJ29_05635 [Candidatus Kapabacteria bacterium]|nr:hypothetical protein [Candidatus Kapabacteria bacterium]